MQKQIKMKSSFDPYVGVTVSYYYEVDYYTMRKAKCDHCHQISESNKSLPFFKEQIREDYDSYFCGCIGWE